MGIFRLCPSRRPGSSVWVALLLLALASLTHSFSVDAQAPVLTSLRPSFVDNHLQLDLVVTEAAPYRVWRTHLPPKIVIDVGAERAESLPAIVQISDPAVKQVRSQSGPLGTRIAIDLAYPLPLPSVERQGSTLTLRIPVRFRDAEETFIRPGVWYGSIRAGAAHGPLSVKYLKIDLRHPEMAIGLALAGTQFGVGPLRALASERGAFAGVNGGFFHWSGRPLGLVVQEGRLLSEDVYRRAALTLGSDGSAQIAHQRVEMWLETDERVIWVDGINRPRAAGEVVVYTPEYGVLPPSTGERVLILNGRVYETALHPMNRVSKGGVLVEFDTQNATLNGLEPGESLNFRHQLFPGHTGGARTALGGGPLLVVDGEVWITGEHERFQQDVLNGRAPRTAVGITADEKLLLVVVDGRNPALSVGVTLEELAQILLDLGAESAMNLDGGGSSTLVLRDLVLNQPSDGDERPVGNGLLLFVNGGA